jgi:hypothetical protein
MKKIINILLLCLGLQSCLNITDPKQQAKYIESYKSFDIKLVDHFPKKVPNNWTRVTYGSPDYIKWSSTTGLSLEIQITSKEKFDSLKKQLEKDSKVIKSSVDSCLLIVDSKKNQTLINCNKYYPIPQETAYDLNNETWIRVEDCEIALIDYKQGVFIKNTSLKPKVNLPDKWKNGFSKGYAFNIKEQKIMYWLIIW